MAMRKPRAGPSGQGQTTLPAEFDQMGADKPGTNLSVGHQCDKAFSPILASRVGFVSSDAGAWRRLPLKQPSRQKQRQGQTILLELLAGLGGVELRKREACSRYRGDGF